MALGDLDRGRGFAPKGDWIGADTKAQFIVKSSHSIELSAYNRSDPLVKCN